MSTFKKIKIRKIYEEDILSYQLAISFKNKTDRDKFFDNEKTMPAGPVHLAKDNELDNETRNEDCVVFSLTQSNFKEHANNIVAMLS